MSKRWNIAAFCVIFLLGWACGRAIDTEAIGAPKQRPRGEGYRAGLQRIANTCEPPTRAMMEAKAKPGYGTGRADIAQHLTREIARVRADLQFPGQQKEARMCAIVVATFAAEYTEPLIENGQVVPDDAILTAFLPNTFR